MATTNTPARSSHSPPMSTGTKVGVGLLVVGGVAAAGLIIFWPRRAAAATASPLARQLAQQATATRPTQRAATNTAPVGHPSRRGLEDSSERARTTQIQGLLNSTLYCGGLTPDGVWGSSTENSARCFSAAMDVAEGRQHGARVAEMDRLIAGLPGTQRDLLSMVQDGIGEVRNMDARDLAVA